MLLYTR